MVGEEGGAESQRLRALGERAEKLERPDTNAPTPTQYNIVVPPVPMWKIRSIARYKRVNYLRKVHEKREVAAAASANTIEGAEETVGEGTGDVTNANKLVIDTGQSPGTNNLADILLGLQSVDAGSVAIESDVKIEGNDNCNCRKSRCLKL